MAESEKELKTLLMKVKEAITSLQIDGEKLKQWQISFSWAPKSLWMETEAIKLKDTCFLETKL